MYSLTKAILKNQALQVEYYTIGDIKQRLWLHGFPFGTNPKSTTATRMHFVKRPMLPVAESLT